MKINDVHSQKQKILHMDVFEKPTTAQGWDWWLPPKGSSARGVQPLHLVQGMSVPTGLVVTSPLPPFSVSLFQTLSSVHAHCLQKGSTSLAPAAAALAQAGKHAKTSPSNRETGAGLVLVLPRLSLKSTGCARQACPSPADSPALSALPSFPSAHPAWLYQWLSLLNGRHILLQTWAD